MSIVLIEVKYAPINVSLHGYETYRCMSSQYSSSETALCISIRCIPQACFLMWCLSMSGFSGIDLPCIDLHDIVFRSIKKSPTSMSRCIGHADTSHDKPTARQRSYDERYAAPHWHFWSYLLMEEMGYIAHTPSPYRLLAAVCYAQRAGEDRLEQDLLSQWPCAWHGLPFCQQSLVMRRSSHKRALVWCQASR